MYECMTPILHKIYYMLCNPGLLKDYIDILTKILTGVGVIIGLGLIRPLKEKTATATFTFWTHLKIRLMGIKRWLEENNNIIANLYVPNLRTGSEDLMPPIQRVSQFKNIIDDTISYMEIASDQMPAYIGWNDDYNKLIVYFKDFIIYDIADPKNYFKFKEKTDNEGPYVEIDIYCKNICKIIEKMCKEIDKKQTSIEEKIAK